jgi:DNA-binding NarL/FixJ family response regulator
VTASSRDEIRPRILLVEDEVLARLALAAMLESGGFRVIQAGSAEEALEVLGAGLDIRAVVTDVELSTGGINGFELARRVHEKHQLGVVVVSGRVAPDAGELPPGVRFVAKPVHKTTFVRLVQDVVGSAPRRLPIRVDVAPEPQAEWTLTPRQQEVLALLVQGKSNREIAEAMGLSENTVKVHLVSIFRALGVSSRVEALLAGLKRLPLREASSH